MDIWKFKLLRLKRQYLWSSKFISCFILCNLPIDHHKLRNASFIIVYSPQSELTSAYDYFIRSVEKLCILYLSGCCPFGNVVTTAIYCNESHLIIIRCKYTRIWCILVTGFLVSLELVKYSNCIIIKLAKISNNSLSPYVKPGHSISCPS